MNATLIVMPDNGSKAVVALWGTLVSTKSMGNSGYMDITDFMLGEDEDLKNKNYWPIVQHYIVSQMSPKVVKSTSYYSLLAMTI